MLGNGLTQVAKTDPDSCASDILERYMLELMMSNFLSEVITS